jgi:chromosome segregation ATPase
VARAGRELEEAVKSRNDLRSTLDLNERRHKETAERLEEERARVAARDEELRALRDQLANQNRALLQQFEAIEKAAKSASRATVDLEVISAVARAKAKFQ